MRLSALLFAILFGCDAPPPAKKAPAPQTPPARAKPLPPPVEADHDDHHEHPIPEFVTRGSGLLRDGERRVFLGLGKHHGIENRNLAHMMADKAADAEIEKQLREVNQRALALAKTKNTKAVEKLTAEWMEKTTIGDHWIDHNDDDWWSLKHLDAHLYVAALAKTLGLSPEQARSLVE